MLERKQRVRKSMETRPSWDCSSGLGLCRGSVSHPAKGAALGDCRVGQGELCCGAGQQEGEQGHRSPQVLHG